MGFISETEFTALLESFKQVEGRDWSVLFDILEKCVEPMVHSWYIGLDNELRGIARPEDDYLLDVKVKLMYKVEGSLKSHEGQEISARAAQLHGWLEWVTRNALRDEFKSLRRDFALIEKMKETQPVIAESYDYEEVEETQRKLNICFRLVINSRRDIHKILFWLNLSIHTLITANGRSAVKKHITPILSEMPLMKMYETVQLASKRLNWMKLTQADIERIENSLEQPYKDGLTYGDAVLSDFYGNRDATAATSDWVNKIDEMIGRDINKWLI